MSRTSLSLELINAMYSEQTDLCVICLLTFTHPSWNEPKRISSNATEVVSYEPLTYATVSDGETYYTVPFDLKTPDDVEEAAPTSQLLIENISGDLIAALRGLDQTQGMIKCVIELVTDKELDERELSYPAFDVRDVAMNANIITVDMRIDAMTEEPYPAYTFDPASFPGLHGTP